MPRSRVLWRWERVATGAFVAPAFGGASARGVDYGGSGRSGAAFALGLVSRPSPAPAQAIFQATGSSTLAAAGLHAAATHAGISLAPAGRLPGWRIWMML